jgi:hypothetical protein
MMRKTHPKKSTIRGYIEVDHSVGDENIVGIKIVTDDDEYTVKINGFGEDLMPFLDEEVEVSGIISEEKDGNKYIKVTGYDILIEQPVDESFFDLDEDYERYEEVIYGDREDDYRH